MPELNRRHLIRSAAWAAPVVAVAATAPLAAASGTGTLSNVDVLTNFGNEIYVTATASPAGLPEILTGHFTINGPTPLTPVSLVSSGDERLLSVSVRFSGAIAYWHTVTINIPGYAAVTSPVYA